MRFKRGPAYSYDDWWRDLQQELGIGGQRVSRPASMAWRAEQDAQIDREAAQRAYANRLQDVEINPRVVYPQAAPCPPGYRYRPKRKPGQRKCTKEKTKSKRTTLSMLQTLAVQNRISIFKIRKDKKGYTRTLLTMPQLKSRLTRNGVSYKFMNSNFGVRPGKGPMRPEDLRELQESRDSDDEGDYLLSEIEKRRKSNKDWRARKASTPEVLLKQAKIDEQRRLRREREELEFAGMTEADISRLKATRRRNKNREGMAVAALLDVQGAPPAQPAPLNYNPDFSYLDDLPRMQGPGPPPPGPYGYEPGTFGMPGMPGPSTQFGFLPLVALAAANTPMGRMATAAAMRTASSMANKVKDRFKEKKTEETIPISQFGRNRYGFYGSREVWQ